MRMHSRNIASSLMSSFLGLSALVSVHPAFGRGAPRPKQEAKPTAAQQAPRVPVNPAFTRLQEAFEYYATVVKKGGWPKVPTGNKILAKNTGEWLNTLGRRLLISGDLPEGALNMTREQALPILENAVKHFQLRHGLKPDARVGKKTLAELNVSADDRARQIQTNMLAWKQISDQHLTGDRYIIVNIPEFMLRAYRNNDEVLKMKVVVGREYTDNATPLFSDVMTTVMFRPYWNVPQSIASEEVVPDTRKDPQYFAKNHMEIVDHWAPDAKVYPLNPENLAKVEAGKLLVQQKPGPENSLGLVKFLFPNKYNIYMHDTPAKHLFNMERRDYSHGCIRVENPVALAQYVLSDEPGQWDAAKIKTAMLQGDQKSVDLTHKIPVYIRYWTTYVDDDGTVQFRKDIYNQMIKVSGL